MTNPQVSPLPPHFNAGGYRITAVLENGPDYYLYQALSPEGQTVLIREFCPQGLVSRDMVSGELSVSPEHQAPFDQAREAFEAQCSVDAQGKLRGFGTVFFLYPAAQPVPEQTPAASVAHAQALRPAQKAQPQLRKPVAGPPIPPAALPKIKKSGGFPVITVIVVGMLALFGFLGYQILKDKDEPVVKAAAPPVVAAPRPKPKPEAPKPEPVVEEPEPEPIVVAPEPEPEPEPEEPAPDLSPSPEILAMEKAIREEAMASKGKFSEKLLAKYPYYAEAYVRDYVKKRGGSFSPEFEKWLKNTKTNREVFAMFFPPDPSVATNVAIMVDELGLEKTEKYNQLVLAFAVGRREFGMGAFDLTQQGRYIDALGKLREFKASGVMTSPADLYCAGKPPINWYGSAPRTVDEELYKKVEAYLDSKKITTKQAWVNKYNTVSEIGAEGITQDNIAGFLHEYMYRHNQLRRKRDPFPTPVEFFTYLVDKYENCSKLRDVDRKRVEWTGVSLEGTPWAAMMALSETRPLRECDSVWERYMGQRGPTRLWLYGPYRMDDDKEPPILFSFDPDPEWSRESNERKLHEGGVCGTMSLISRNSQIARGIPAAPAGQPGHGNLMTTNFNGNGCWLSVGQSVDTLKATTGFWYLRDSQAMRTGNAEYQSGLALSMNLDYEKFINSRFSMNVYKLAGGSVSTEEASGNSSGTLPKEFTVTAMRTILKDNPFYTEAWYTLFQQEPMNLMGARKMVEEVREALPDGMGIRKLWKTRKYVSSVGRGDKKGKEILANQTQEYVNVLCSVILENALKQDNEYKTFQWAELMAWLKSESKHNTYPEPQAAYQIAYARAQGTDRLKRTVDRGFKKAVNFYRDDNNALAEPKDVDQQDMSFSLNALCMVLPQEELLSWMKGMLDTCPDGFKYKPKNKKETKIHPFYSALTKNYTALADSSEKSRIKSDMKSASDRILELSNKKKGDAEESSGRRRRR